MEALGLHPTTRSFATRLRSGEGVMVHNLVGVLPGTDPSLPAVAMMSHYDSTRHGPGAGDDAAGVAASLEVARALKAAGPHRRDLVVLVTDGEEAGLLGAKAFFAMDVMAPRIGAVINLEARGNAGRAVMFETHPGAGPMIAALRRAGALTGASSLMPDLYRRLPNDTDLSEALKAGKLGLNFAFFGGEAHYHQPTDIPANLDPGSVQHIGEQALAAAGALVDAPALPGRGADAVYGDLLGGPVLQYPPWAGWIVLAAAAAGLAVAAQLSLTQGAARWPGLAVGVLTYVAMIAAAYFALVLVGGLAGRRLDGMQRLLQHFPQALAGYALVAAGAALLVLAIGRRRRTGPETEPWIGALVALLLLAAVVQAIAPLTAFMLAWPLMLGVLATLLHRLCGRIGRVAAGVLITFGLAQVFYWAGLLFSLVGVGLPVVLAAFVGLAAPLLMPLAAPVFAQRNAWAAALAAGLAGAALVIAAA
jgi:hypothetical protein